jgi:hypothetical protein
MICAWATLQPLKMTSGLLFFQKFAAQIYLLLQSDNVAASAKRFCHHNAL